MRELEKSLGDLSVESVGIKELKEKSKNCGIIIVDMLRGFCETGPLQSPYNKALAEPISRLVKAWQGPILSVEDSHQEDDNEFEAFPPHCVKGSEEAQVVEPILSALKEKEYEIVKKRTLSPFFGAWGYEDWLTKQKDRQVREFYIVGNCTDLCVYQTALGTKMWFGEKQTPVSVNVVVNLVDTYDIPSDEAPEGVPPHPRELINRVFLHHLSLNKIKLVEVENI